MQIVSVCRKCCCSREEEAAAWLRAPVRLCVNVERNQTSKGNELQPKLCTFFLSLFSPYMSFQSTNLHALSLSLLASLRIVTPASGPAEWC